MSNIVLFLENLLNYSSVITSDSFHVINNALGYQWLYFIFCTRKIHSFSVVTDVELINILCDEKIMLTSYAIYLKINKFTMKVDLEE